MHPSAPGLLMRVATTWPLPGLGLLALPDGPASLLLPYALHTALAITARLPDGRQLSGPGTVEEVSRPETGDVPVRGLLLDLGTTSELPAGTAIWLAATSADALL